MIKLTAEQLQALQKHPGLPLPMMDPDTKQTFVLIGRELYDSLAEYDDSPWTAEEMDLLAAEVDAMLDDETRRRHDPWSSEPSLVALL